MQQGLAHNEPPESIGKRIGQLRTQRSLTQQALASRLALSRVAISHFEMDLSLPSERTILLLAGIFKISPIELVDGTTYPPAKAERLPENIAWFTPLELDVALFKNDLEWLNRVVGNQGVSSFKRDIHAKWYARFIEWNEAYIDEKEKELITWGLEQLRTIGIN